MARRVQVPGLPKAPKAPKATKAARVPVPLFPPPGFIIVERYLRRKRTKGR